MRERRAGSAEQENRSSGLKGLCPFRAETTGRLQAWIWGLRGPKSLALFVSTSEVPKAVPAPTAQNRARGESERENDKRSFWMQS